MPPVMLPREESPNALMLGFLQDMADAAEEKGSRSAQTFKRAVRGLEKSSIQFTHPSETSQIPGIGPGIIAALTKRWLAHCKENRIHVQAAGADVQGSQAKKRGAVGGEASTSKKTKRAAVDDVEEQEFSSDSSLGVQSRKHLAAAAIKPKAPRKVRPYIPAKRSGAYAIILALGSTIDDEFEAGRTLTKGEIEEVGAEWSDKSFQTSGEPGKYHSAWSSMKTLIDKGLVCQHGRPARFNLSDTGVRLAEVLKDALEEESDRLVPQPPLPSSVASVAASSRYAMDAHDGKRLKQTKSAPITSMGTCWDDPPAVNEARLSEIAPAGRRLDSRAALSAAMGREDVYDGCIAATGPATAIIASAAAAAPKPERFWFHFVDRSNYRVKFRDEARSKLTDTGEYLCKVEFRSSQLGLPFVRANIVECEQAEKGRDVVQTHYGWIFQSDIASTSNGLPSPPALSNSLPVTPLDLFEVSASTEVSVPAVSRTHRSSQSPLPSSPSAPGKVLEFLSMPTFSSGPIARASFASTFASRPAPLSVSLSQTATGPSYSTEAAASRPTSAPQLRTSPLSTVATAALKPPASSSSLKAPRAVPTALGKRTNSNRLPEHVPQPSAIFELDSHFEGSEASGSGTTDGAEDDGILHSASNGARTASEITPITWPPGTYDITLVIDNREVKSRKERDVFAKRLLEMNVPVLTRALPLGDMLWIAKRKDGAGEECVLDYIIERKRLDDLTTSIKDGRYSEQKFRLRASGIGQVIYLVEEYNADYHYAAWPEQIATALSSTQVIEGFFLKRTMSLDDTLAYLGGLHETIVKLHEDQTLNVIPDRCISKPTYSMLQASLRKVHVSSSFLTSYASFQALNSKSGAVTLRDLWSKMLLRIRGMSPEKVRATIEVYPTPVSLWRAFIAAENTERKEMAEEAAEASRTGKQVKKSKVVPAKHLLVSTVGVPLTRSHLGQALSERIYEVFRSHY